MRRGATSGRHAGAIALLLALAGCGLVPPATTPAEPPALQNGSRPADPAATGGTTGGSVAGKALMSEGTAMMGQAGRMGPMGAHMASGSMMSGDHVAQMMGMMGAGMASGSMMSAGSGQAEARTGATDEHAAHHP
ncbi:MAG: hypothetical protein FJZ01_26280 [Candidatus Sericytochromatia bacterium]|nr:hypothetical protein [Candidatus Tanganyikabacteria bacterium]